ncbi:MAG: hypothetical protein LQ344_006681 [Seirophora lacunosa]|nr:MAG: hypothetical protein LQ344_006681 [Seirophora lacunosa]
MASSPLQQVQYTSNQTAQDAFASSHYDTSSSTALTSYMRSIHQYTQSQLEHVKRSSERRTHPSSSSSEKGVGNPVASLTPESSVDSVESVEGTS